MGSSRVRKPLSVRTALTVFALQCVAIGSFLLSCWLYMSWTEFIGPVVRESWDLALRFRTSVIQPVGLVALVIALFIQCWRKGWHEMKAHWLKHLLESLLPAVGAVLLIFMYNLVIAVPSRIRSTAAAVRIRNPQPNIPSVLIDFHHTSPIQPSQGTLQPRAWLQVARTYSQTRHVVTIVIKNCGQIPAFSIRLIRSFQIDTFDKGKQAIFIGEGSVVQYDQVASQGEFSVALGTDNPVVRQFLEKHRPKGPFSIRVSGDMRYNDTETTVPHPLQMCYMDLGFALTNDIKVSCSGPAIDCTAAEIALKHSSLMSECPETGLNVSR